ncbi:MAG TPA: aminodeoxychorismate/anthranilate synthase component I, partial [Pirellulaceae bacterium]|nr:aminodeoxychorismate/anthranilate synthase component I [Pirellulaceae bacterium]
MKIELPLVRELSSSLQPVDVFRRLSRRSHCLFLDSALKHKTLGRYSFVTADPFDFFVAQPGCPNHLDEIESTLKRLRCDAVPKLPPFQGG